MLRRNIETNESKDRINSVSEYKNVNSTLPL